jgi:signal peptidase I/conjugal transfer pilin signal peptidase TrbI
MTPSLKNRVYWINHDPETVKRGDYVMFHFADIAAQYKLDDKREMMKIIGCNEGETLTVNDEKEYYCNGEYLGVKAKEISLKGEPLKNFVPPAGGKVPAGFMFVIGQHKDSLDSRYFGFIEKSRILAKAFPIF